MDRSLPATATSASASHAAQEQSLNSTPMRPRQRRARCCALSATLRRVVGGTSGPLYAVMLLRAAVALEQSGGAYRAAMGGSVQRRCRWIDGVGWRAARRSHDGRCAEARRRRAAQPRWSRRRRRMPRCRPRWMRQRIARCAPHRCIRGAGVRATSAIAGHVDAAHAVALWLAAIRDALAG